MSDSISRSTSLGVSRLPPNGPAKAALKTQAIPGEAEEESTKSYRKLPSRRVWLAPRIRKIVAAPRSDGADVDASPFELSMRNVKLKVVFAPLGLSDSRRRAHQRMMWYWRFSRNWESTRANWQQIANVIEMGPKSSQGCEQDLGGNQKQSQWIWFWRWRQSLRIDMPADSEGEACAPFATLRSRFRRSAPKKHYEAKK